MGLQRNNSLGVKNVDIEDAHYYPMNTDQMISDAQTAYKAGKVFYIGEYGWNQGDLPGYLSAIEADSSGQGYLVSGDTYWSLFPNGVDHQDMPNVSFTLHVAADDSAMAQAVAELTAHAKVMSASSVGNVLASSSPTPAATSESTTVPTTESTTAPTTVPTTESTIVPTTVPTTESTIVPTTVPTNGAASNNAPGNAPIGKTIWLKSYINNDYVNVRVNKTNAPLAAQGTTLSSAEEFDVIDAGNGYIALKAHANGNYVSAWQQDSYTPLEARVNHMEAWEWFRWVDLGHNRVALETYDHQDYVSAWQQARSVPLEARVAHMESWETFKWGEV
jgi:hypothetical protein